jgi:transcriptional regulator with XRE-family HTH domain
MQRREPNPIDKLVGRNIRIHRLKKNMSQEKLGDALGLTFQQVQKYEKGTNRVGAGRLHQIACIFGVSVTALFEGSDIEPGSGGLILDLLADPHSLRIIEAMAEISDSSLRRSVVELVEQIAASQHTQAGSSKRRGVNGPR